MRSRKPARRVLDAWALMGWIMDEPAANRVEPLLRQAAEGQLDLAMNMVNVGEVYYSLAKRGRREAATQLLDQLPAMPIRGVIPSAALIIEAAKLKSWFAISYADAFAVATAIQEKASLVTGDPELRVFRGPFSKPEREVAKQARRLKSEPSSPAGIVKINWIGRRN